MGEHQGTNRGGKEEMEHRSHHKKKTSRPLYDQLKASDEGGVPVDFVAGPSLERHTRLPAGGATHLQQSCSNAYVQHLLGSRAIQAKLTVSTPNDIYEQEADRVAEAVTGVATSHVQCHPQEEEELQRQLAGRQPSTASEDLETRINNVRGSGQPLTESLRASLEPQFGHDFSQVRIHTGAEPDGICQQLGAQAFTTGRDIFFREGAYQPESESGKRLLAHELTHVVQQKAAPALQTKADIQHSGAEDKADDDVEARSQRTRGSGQLFSDSIQEPMEQTKVLKLNDITTVMPDDGALFIQRVVMAVGDLAELYKKWERTGTEPTSEEIKLASVITNEVDKRVEATKERVWRKWKKDILADIDNEELRIHGHGGIYEGDETVSKLGGYTAEALADKLVLAGLPETYSGEIYLAGCETAKGDKDNEYGYLGLFYEQIVTHCPNVKVRGNISYSTTFEDGSQGVWTGECYKTEEEVRNDRRAIREQVEFLQNKAQRMIDEDEAERAKVREAILSKKYSEEELELQARALNLKSEKYEAEALKLRAEGVKLKEKSELIARKAYSDDSRYTRVLPS